MSSAVEEVMGTKPVILAQFLKIMQMPLNEKNVRFGSNRVKDDDKNSKWIARKVC